MSLSLHDVFGSSDPTLDNLSASVEYVLNAIGQAS